MNLNYYWEPHSSSIDFCESNYLHSPYIVEFHNTWSSLVGICTFGFIGLLWNNPLDEIRTSIAYSIIILVGIGSVGLHATLHEFFQATDELPMLYMNSVLHYMCLEYNAPLSGNGRRQCCNYPNLPYNLVAMSFFQTFLYYKYQYAYEVFIAMYGNGVLLLLLLFLKMAFYDPYKENNQATRAGEGEGTTTTTISSSSRKLGLLGIGSYLLVGLPVWILDMNYCDSILDITTTRHDENNNNLGWFFFIMNGITPHVLWHFAASFGTYCAISSIVAFRLEKLNIPFRLTYYWYFVPITTLVVQEKKED